MRLTSHEQETIKEVIHRLDGTAKIYLFGSRADDQKRGGDIDLLIVSELITDRDRRHLRLQLFEKLGEQKIDLVISKDLSKPFERIAYSQGVLL